MQHVFIRDQAGDFPVTPVDTSIVDALMNPTAYEHPVDTVELIETHISWLLLARNIAARHAAAQVIDESQRDIVVTRTRELIWGNITALNGFIGDDDLDLLRNWTEQELEKLEPVLWQRFDNGFVRDCHGDLHLTNLVRLRSGITTFDCIEFNADLRHIDVACDIAFLVMDLVARQRHDLAAHFLNRYLESTGDYDSMKVLSLYFVYRCLVLAKVATILSQEHEPDADPEANLSEVHSYCEMAKRQIALRTPILIVMCGLSGSGKTRVSGEVMAAIPAIRIRSDIERKRMFGLSEHEDSASDLGKGLYTQQTSHAVYAHLLRTAQMILESGHSVILDAAFLREENRVAAVRVAQDCGCFPILLQVLAPHDILRDRVRQRIAYANDASEAGLDVLQQQIENAEPLSPEERQRVIVCDNSGSLDISTIVSRIVKMPDSGRSMNARR